MSEKVARTTVQPEGVLKLLSKVEVARLLDASQGGLYQSFRGIALAVLNCGGEITDGRELLNRFHDFDLRVVQNPRGISLELINAPASAFVDGQIIRGISEHLFAVLRDVIFVADDVVNNDNIDLNTQAGVSDAVFHILRNAAVLKPHQEPKLVVCWGGHSISRHEYDYTKEVGYELGLRGLNICTGCGIGAMKGPMKGAALAHAKQRISDGQYLGISEPGIIAAESPNPIVNDLVIMPDIEKRLEAFVRTGHSVLVFPGGAGTAEEILYILGVLLHPNNADIPYPLIFTGPESSASYFEQIDAFIKLTLGEAAQEKYQIIIGNPPEVARRVLAATAEVTEFRKRTGDAFYYNWQLHIPLDFQQPFAPLHSAVAKLPIQRNLPVHELAANLRRIFSVIVAGNVKAEGMRQVEEHGLYQIKGDADIMAALDELLAAFVADGRMKSAETYKPCYEIVG